MGAGRAYRWCRSPPRVVFDLCHDRSQMSGKAQIGSASVVVLRVSKELTNLKSEEMKLPREGKECKKEERGESTLPTKIRDFFSWQMVVIPWSIRRMREPRLTRAEKKTAD